MIEPSTRRNLLAVVILFSFLVPVLAQPRPGAAPSQSRPGEFARQWKEVRAKNPLVASAYLELVEATLANRSTCKLPVRFSLCDLPAFANLDICKTPSGRPEPPKVCPSCRPARNSEDVERYLECLEKRIACLG
jgi:hypothetical protein